MNHGRGTTKLTEVTASDKLESFRASKEVPASDENSLFFFFPQIFALETSLVFWF